MKREINIRIPRFDGYKTVTFNTLVMTFFLVVAAVSWIEGTQLQITPGTMVLVVVTVCAVNLLLRCVTDTPLLAPISNYDLYEDREYVQAGQHGHISAFEQAALEREQDEQVEPQAAPDTSGQARSHRVTSHAIDADDILKRAMEAASAPVWLDHDEGLNYFTLKDVTELEDRAEREHAAAPPENKSVDEAVEAR